MSTDKKKKGKGASTGIAVFIAILFVLTAIFGLLGFNVWRVLFNPTLVKGTLTHEVTSTEIIPSTLELFSKWRAQQRVENEESLSGVNEPDIVLLVSFLEAEDWQEIRDLLITDEFVVDIISDSVDGFYRWIDSDDNMPDTVWDLSPLKQRMDGQEGIDSIMVAYESMPEATDEQIADFRHRLSQVPAGVEVLYNLAQFPEPWYEDQVNDYIDAFHDTSDNIPEMFEVSSLLNNPTAEQTAVTAKYVLRLVRTLAMTFWIAALVLLLLIFVIKVRSFKSLGKFVGIPLLIVGIVGLVIAIVAQPMVIDLVLGRLQAAATDFARAEITATLESLSAVFFNPLLIQSGVLGGLGLVLIILGVAVRKKPAETEVNTAE